MAPFDTHPLPLDPPASSACPAWLLRAPGADRRSLGAGMVLFEHESASGDDLWAVVRGAVSVDVTTEAGRAATLMILGPGDALVRSAAGEAGRRGSSPRLMLRTLIPSEVVRVPGGGVRRACAVDASAATGLVALSARQSERLARRLELALTASVPERVLRSLGDLAAVHGIRRRGGGGVEVALPLTQDALASLTGATRESVNRALRTLVARGEILRTGGRYVVPGPS